MFEHISLNEFKEEWRTSATRHKVGIIVLAIVVIDLSIAKLLAPPEQIVPIKPIYTPTHHRGYLMNIHPGNDIARLNAEPFVTSCWGNAFASPSAQEEAAWSHP